MAETKKYPIFSELAPSELIERIVMNLSTPVADCEHCGRVHYDSTGEDMENAEYEELLLKQKEDPEKFIGNPGKVPIGNVNSKQTVIGCPCNALKQFEDMIWGNRTLICEYITQRANAIKTNAAATEKSARDAARTIAGA